MKKGGILTVLLLTISFLTVNNASAYLNGIGACSGHDSFNSFSGNEYYDAVEICGLCYACQNSASDGICPEDFGDENGRASCTNFPDSDCVSRVSGNAYDIEGNFLKAVKITAIPPPGTSLSQVVELTDNAGGYFIEEIPSGRWVFRAEKAGYDTVVEEKIIEYGKTNLLDFTLPEGTCNSDCTNSFGRCSADCDGVNGCTYINPIVQQLCDNQLPGTEVVVNESGEFVNKYECCNSNIEIKEFRPKAVIHGDMDELVLRELVVRMNNDIVKAKIAIWQ